MPKALPSDRPAPQASRLTVSRPQLLIDGTDGTFRELLHDTLAFSGRIQEVRARFGAILGLSASQYTILITISHLQGDDGIGINHIADHLHLSGAFVTIEVNKLVKRQFVTKRLDPRDRRRVRIKLTDAGREHLDRLLPLQRPVNDALYAELTIDEFRQLHAIMAKLVANGDAALRLLAYLEADL